MSTTTPRRVYAVTRPGTGTTRLVRAVNVATALRHVVRTDYRCEVASQDALIEHLLAGAKVEDAGADDATDPVAPPSLVVSEPDLFVAPPLAEASDAEGLDMPGESEEPPERDTLTIEMFGQAQDEEAATERLGSPSAATREPQAQATAAAARRTGAMQPHYRNPLTGEYWSGRGLKPKWLATAMEEGKTMADFYVGPA